MSDTMSYLEIGTLMHNAIEGGLRLGLTLSAKGIYSNERLCRFEEDEDMELRISKEKLKRESNIYIYNGRLAKAREKEVNGISLVKGMEVSETLIEKIIDNFTRIVIEDTDKVTLLNFTYELRLDKQKRRGGC